MAFSRTSSARKKLTFITVLIYRAANAHQMIVKSTLSKPRGCARVLPGASAPTSVFRLGSNRSRFFPFFPPKAATLRCARGAMVMQ